MPPRAPGPRAQGPGPWPRARGPRPVPQARAPSPGPRPGIGPMSEPRVRAPDPRAPGPGPKARAPGLWPQAPGLGARDAGPGPGPWLKDSKPRAPAPGPWRRAPGDGPGPRALRGGSGMAQNILPPLGSTEFHRGASCDHVFGDCGGDGFWASFGTPDHPRPRCLTFVASVHDESHAFVRHCSWQAPQRIPSR